MTRSFLFGSLLSLSLGAACGGAETGSNTSTGGGSSGGAMGSSGGSAGGSGASGAPGNCGGQKCSFDQRCAHKTCGAPDSEGKCASIPLDCILPPDTWRPVCDCDGYVHTYDCGSMDLAPPENCKMFPCGGSDCVIATQYCERQVSDAGGVRDVYSCKTLPTGCAGATNCACVRSETCGARCAGTGSLGMVLTCPGG